jgi:outer membrane protein OmpA-like peptidoglycan-associated protein
MFDENTTAEENVGWPSYVDFLSTFAFILMLFIGSTVYLISDVERRELVAQRMEGLRTTLAASGFHPSAEGNMLRVPLSGKVAFEPLKSTLNATAESNLRIAGKEIGTYHGVQKIVVQGYADRDPVRITLAGGRKADDPFGNLNISVQRALSVLQFFYDCSDCGYNVSDIRPRLALRGEGDTDANKKQTLNSDRRVDILIYF